MFVKGVSFNFPFCFLLPKNLSTHNLYFAVLNKEKHLIGHPAPQSIDIFVVPTGLRDLLLYIKNKYRNPEVYVTENGESS